MLAQSVRLLYYLLLAGMEALASVQKNGVALADLAEDLRKDRAIVLAAVKQNGMALQFAAEDLQGDRAI
eukprot:1362346-Amphidinium_carterae.1